MRKPSVIPLARLELFRVKRSETLATGRGCRLPPTSLSKLLNSTSACYPENKTYDSEYRPMLEEPRVVGGKSQQTDEAIQ
jgi:hypothetical protein